MSSQQPVTEAVAIAVAEKFPAAPSGKSMGRLRSRSAARICGSLLPAFVLRCRLSARLHVAIELLVLSGAEELEEELEEELVAIASVLSRIHVCPNIDHAMACE